MLLSISPVSWFVEEIADAELNQVYDILIHKTQQAEPGTEVMIDALVLFGYINCISCYGHSTCGIIANYWQFFVHKNWYTNNLIVLSVDGHSSALCHETYVIKPVYSAVFKYLIGIFPELLLYTDNVDLKKNIFDWLYIW